ncbi:hypothetical protein X801_05914 [Opisthorchis viverrini]|uniref:Uncharacterized protein n=1 Tax=Opisthorchis viverrini TaxID=6198 RepID=A0A1S8WV81_OPIVI|nr:hypothetical protein X801_05914 [Opisthorchis viverrini]
MNELREEQTNGLRLALQDVNLTMTYNQAELVVRMAGDTLVLLSGIANRTYCTLTYQNHRGGRAYKKHLRRCLGLTNNLTAMRRLLAATYNCAWNGLTGMPNRRTTVHLQMSITIEPVSTNCAPHVTLKGGNGVIPGRLHVRVECDHATSDGKLIYPFSAYMWTGRSSDCGQQLSGRTSLVRRGQFTPVGERSL